MANKKVCVNYYNFNPIVLIHEKIMATKKVCVNYYNFNPIVLIHESIHVKSTGTQVKKMNYQGIL
jgi:hypothetical protein